MMKIKKTLGTAAGATALVAASLWGASSATAAQPAPGDADLNADYSANSSLSPDEIDARTIEISETYTKVGDVLSDEDAEFIKIYGDQAGQEPEDQAIKAIVSAPFSGSGSGAGGTGSISGTYTTDNGEFSTNNGYSGTLNASGSSSVTKITNCFNVRAYGTVGEAGVGVVFSDDPCQTNNGTSNSMSVDKRYSAFVVYSTITANATFTTSSGTFQVSSAL